MSDHPPAASANRELATRIVAAYVRRNQIGADQIPTLISTVHQALTGLGQPKHEAAGPQTPAVPIRQSVRHDYVVCLECGWRGQTLRRHITAAHGFTAEEYRRRWNGTVKLRHYSKDWVQSGSVSCREGRGAPLRCRF